MKRFFSVIFTVALLALSLTAFANDFAENTIVLDMAESADSIPDEVIVPDVELPNVELSYTDEDAEYSSESLKELFDDLMNGDYTIVPPVEEDETAELTSEHSSDSPIINALKTLETDSTDASFSDELTPFLYESVFGGYEEISEEIPEELPQEESGDADAELSGGIVNVDVGGMFDTIKYYKDYYGVPDFGYNLNIPLYDSIDGLFIYPSYYVEDYDLKTYDAMLAKCGFSFVTGADTNSGGYMLWYVGSKYTVGFGFDYIGSSQVICVFINENKPTQSVKYYSKYPGVPDFGANYGIPLLTNYESLYCYNVYYVDKYDIENYDALLKKCGFRYIGSFDTDNGGTMLCYTGSKYTVAFGVDVLGGVGVIAVTIVENDANYDVKYNANGGTGAPKAQVKKSDKKLRLSSGKPKRDGYDFVGWSTSSTATVAQYMPGDYYTINSDVVLYAVWQKKQIKVTKISLDQTKLDMIVGGTAVLYATVYPSNASDQSVYWMTSDYGIASVEDGVITAREAGKVKITAISSNGKKVTCNVTVGAPADAVEFTGVKSTSLAAGKSVTLKAKAYCKDGSKPVSTNVTYEIIYGDDCASIDSKGKLKTYDVGEITVRATAVAGTSTAYADLSFTVCIPATKVTLNSTKSSMILGGNSLQLIATKAPYNSTDTITWSSSNDDIATVDENGVVTAYRAGSVKITAKSGSGKKATCSISIGAPADAVEFSKLKSTSLAVGKTLTLKAKAFRKDGAKPIDTGVYYEIISGNNCATIDSKGKLKAIASGEVVVRATALAGTYDAYADITINVCVPITKIKFSQSKITLYVGDSVSLQMPAITPYNNTDTVEYYSSNERIVKIDEYGNVVAVASGTAKIYAKSGSGKSAYYTIKVQK